MFIRCFVFQAGDNSLGVDDKFLDADEILSLANCLILVQFSRQKKRSLIRFNDLHFKFLAYLILITHAEKQQLSFHAKSLVEITTTGRRQ